MPYVGFTRCSMFACCVLPLLLWLTRLPSHTVTGTRFGGPLRRSFRGPVARCYSWPEIDGHDRFGFGQSSRNSRTLCHLLAPCNARLTTFTAGWDVFFFFFFFFSAPGFVFTLMWHPRTHLGVDHLGKTTKRMRFTRMGKVTLGHVGG